ncbi:hypothetical protein PMI07_006330 [Rhizobium sp. CF080]|uniref:GTPase-associated system all-helical protein GASH n=1 Tax=Rhizobium sp. (strain CF080) TaxID=1144310 RepID=UPI0002718115|nr:GTPase-associated system all-helical protein GASH [Rhizobium sp. CF080]EUC00050.1 hypothetical protein PMI07_006330 [Rhizobium sp. CF080]
MAQDILQRFLTKRLFDLAGDDARLQKLREAADDVANLLKASPNRVASFVQVGCDLKVPPDEPILAEVATIVEKKWNSYLSAFPEKALPVVMRAVILDGLARVMAIDAVALATCLTARNFLPHLGASTDIELWEELISEAGTRLEQRARKEWALPTKNASTLELDIPATPSVTVQTLKVDWVTNLFGAAAGPHDANSKAYEAGNQHWPNTGASWSYEFAPRAAKAVAAAVDASVKANIEKVIEALKPDEHLKSFADQVGLAVASALQQAHGLERRTSMIWWKEALFSPEAEVSYRALSTAKTCAWMAVDAAAITGAYAPLMAEAVISEALRSLLGPEADEPISLATLLSDVAHRGSAIDEKLQGHFASVYRASGRTQLTSLLVEGEPAQYLGTRLGLAETTSISPVGFSLWIYRDLQIANATVVAPRTRKKST